MRRDALRLALAEFDAVEADGGFARRQDDRDLFRARRSKVDLDAILGAVAEIDQARGRAAAVFRREDEGDAVDVAAARAPVAVSDQRRDEAGRARRVEAEGESLLCASAEIVEKDAGERRADQAGVAPGMAGRNVDDEPAGFELGEGGEVAAERLQLLPARVERAGKQRLVRRRRRPHRLGRRRRRRRGWRRRRLRDLGIELVFDRIETFPAPLLVRRPGFVARRAHDVAPRFEPLVDLGDPIDVGRAALPRLAARAPWAECRAVGADQAHRSRRRAASVVPMIRAQPAQEDRRLDGERRLRLGAADDGVGVLPFQPPHRRRRRRFRDDGRRRRCDGVGVGGAVRRDEAGDADACGDALAVRLEFRPAFRVRVAGEREQRAFRTPARRKDVEAARSDVVVAPLAPRRRPPGEHDAARDSSLVPDSAPSALGDTRERRR